MSTVFLKLVWSVTLCDLDGLFLLLPPHMFTEWEQHSVRPGSTQKKKKAWERTLFTDRTRTPTVCLPPHPLFLLTLPFTSTSSSLFHSLLHFQTPCSWPLIKMACSPRLSVPVKCNPKSTASSPTTILMVMGAILYQGYHILLEMTVSKVGVDAMGTKRGSSFLPEPGCVFVRAGCERLSVCLWRWIFGGVVSIKCECSYCPSPHLFGDMMRWDCIVHPFLCYFYFERETELKCALSNLTRCSPLKANA